MLIIYYSSFLTLILSKPYFEPCFGLVGGGWIGLVATGGGRVGLVATGGGRVGLVGGWVGLVATGGGVSLIYY